MEKQAKKQIIGRDVAIKDLDKYLDLLEVPEDDRIDFDPEEGEKEKDDVMREKMIKAIMSGRLIVGKDGQLEYTLKSPLKKKDSEDVLLTKLTFKLRYREFELESNMKGVNPKDFLPVMRAYVATLTGVSKSWLSRLYNVDTTILQAIYTVFTRGDA